MKQIIFYLEKSSILCSVSSFFFLFKDVMVLLDLLGGPNPKFYNHFEETTGWYNLLVDIESRLRDAGGLVEYAHSSANSRKQHPGYFQPYSLFNMPIEDDHIPFLKRDVKIDQFI